jgi:hypothetical protein
MVNTTPKIMKREMPKVGPKYQSEDTCGGSQRSGQGSAKIPKGRRSRQRRNFRIRGIIREEERLLVVRSSPEKPN